MHVTLPKAIAVYLLTVPVFFLIDLLWLGWVAKDFYQQRLGYLMKPQINWAAAISFYLLFLAGLVIFVIKPALEAGSPTRAMVYGALFGFFTYATYDLTNLATIRDWPLSVTLVDLLWGMILCVVVSWAGYFLSVKLL